jgi:hypothetical protein
VRPKKLYRVTSDARNLGRIHTQDAPQSSLDPHINRKCRVVAIREEINARGDLGANAGKMSEVFPSLARWSSPQVLKVSLVRKPPQHLHKPTGSIPEPQACNGLLRERSQLLCRRKYEQTVPIDNSLIAGKQHGQRLQTLSNKLDRRLNG